MCFVARKKRVYLCSLALHSTANYDNKYIICTVASSTVYVFDVVPKSHQLSGAVEKGGATADKAAEEVGLSERQKVQLLSANSIVVDVICTGDSNNTVLVVSYVIFTEKGIFYVFYKNKLIYPFCNYLQP